jgi:hypothetical protein
MHTRAAILAATTVVATLIPAAVAGKGRANINNQCKETAYIWSVVDSADAKMVTLAPGGSHSETYRVNNNGGGVSLKMAVSQSQAEVSQFEYTVHDSESKVYYDLSNINGYPFKDGGITVTPSDSSCVPITCNTGVAQCHQAYNQPYDDHATHGCALTCDLNLVLCAGTKKRNMQHPHYRYA